jgi:hypothetical protein
MRDLKRIAENRRGVTTYNIAAGLLFVLMGLLLFAGPPAVYAQAPPISGPINDEEKGFHRGISAGIRFDSSFNDDGRFFDLSSTAGYNFTRHFGVDLSMPFHFIGTPLEIRSNNPQGSSGSGIGDLGINFKVFLPAPINYAPSVHIGLPTGDKNKGFGTGHVTWTATNHFDHSFGRFTPFIDAGVGNTVLDTWQFQRPYTLFGYSGQFEAGTSMDLGPFSFSASAYDILPWGGQTIISRVYRCPKGTTCTPPAGTQVTPAPTPTPTPVRCPARAKCTPAGTSTTRRDYLVSSVVTGVADLARDNGWNASVEVHPRQQFNLEFDYSRSVPLHLDTFSFGLGINLTAFHRMRH